MRASLTDIVGSTRRAAEQGDRRWRELLDTHDQLAGRLVDRWGGRLVKTTGDGVLATFEGPGRALGCVTALRDELAEISVQIRAGLHTGEVELRGDDVGGIAIHIAAPDHGRGGRRRDPRLPDRARPGRRLRRRPAGPWQPAAEGRGGRLASYSGWPAADREVLVAGVLDRSSP
jgi:hypothetical protein